MIIIMVSSQPTARISSNHRESLSFPEHYVIKHNGIRLSQRSQVTSQINSHKKGGFLKDIFSPLMNKLISRGGLNISVSCVMKTFFFIFYLFSLSSGFVCVFFFHICFICLAFLFSFTSLSYFYSVSSSFSLSLLFFFSLVSRFIIFCVDIHALFNFIPCHFSFFFKFCLCSFFCYSYSFLSLKLLFFCVCIFDLLHFCILFLHFFSSLTHTLCSSSQAFGLQAVWFDLRPGSYRVSG